MATDAKRVCASVACAVVLGGLVVGAQTARAQTWQAKDAGTYKWSDAANWDGAAPSARGAVAHINGGAKGNTIIQLKQAVTLGTLNIGDANAAKSTTTIEGGPGGAGLVFEGATPGAPTSLTLTQGEVSDGTRLNLSAGIRLGGSSPLTLKVVSPAAFECAIGGLDLNGNTFTLEGGRRFNTGSAWRGVDWQIKNISGSGNYVQNGAGTTVEGNCADFTGTLTVNNGEFNAKWLPAVSQYVVAGAFMNKDKYPRGGFLNIGHHSPEVKSLPVTARLNPKASLVFAGGGYFLVAGQDFSEMAFFGAVRPVVVEQLRQIQFLSGLSEMEVSNGNQVSSCTILRVTDPTNALVRNAGATVLIGGDGWRSQQGYWAALGTAEKLLFASGMSKQLKGGGGPPGSKNRSIIPWITNGTMHHPGEGGLVSYDEVNGVRSLMEHEEYDHTLKGTPDRNVKSDQLDLGTNGAQTVNALLYTGWTNSDIGAGSTLTITSGELMIGGMGGSSIGANPEAAGTLNFGPAEGIIWTSWPAPFKDGLNTIGSTIAGSGGLTKTATATLILTGVNTYTGKTCVAAGILQVGDSTVAKARLGDGDVEVANGATLSIKSKVANAILDTATVTLCNAGTAFYGVMDLDSGVNETVGALVLDGKRQPAGTYGSKASPAVHKLDNYFTGGGVLTVTGKAKARP